MSTQFETYGLDDISALVTEWGLPKFRAKQIIEWVYGRGVTSYDEMTNLPKTLREKLQAEAPLSIPSVINKQVSSDGARKYVLQLSDGACIETVGIPSRERDASGAPKRLTVCFSTQVGCPMACAFCATGTEGFTRNLLPGEIVQQVLTVARDFGTRVSNVVGMGQGEPFLNYQNVCKALRIINSVDALGIGARHITVSTCGVLSGIAQFAAEPEQFVLAVSLHSAIQATRDQVMLKCSGSTLNALHQAFTDYWDVCRRRVSLEYLLIQGVNDDERHLEALIDFCNGLHVHVNLLQLNYIEGSQWVPVEKQVVQHWVRELSSAGIETSIRDSRGSDIAAACGQLKNNL